MKTSRAKIVELQFLEMPGNGGRWQTCRFQETHLQVFFRFVLSTQNMESSLVATINWPTTSLIIMRSHRTGGRLGQSRQRRHLPPATVVALPAATTVVHPVRSQLAPPVRTFPMTWATIGIVFLKRDFTQSNFLLQAVKAGHREAMGALDFGDNHRSKTQISTSESISAFKINETQYDGH